MNSGEYLSAYEIALAGLENTPGDSALQYIAVLALARMGATQQAKQSYINYDLASVAGIDAAALGARIEKDIAINAPENDKAKHFLAAAERYKSVYEAHQSDDYYPAINAASMYYLAGAKGQAKELAHRTLELLQDSESDYWSLASEAEAELLSGNPNASIDLLTRAVALDDATFANKASTRRQFKLLTEDDSVLAPLELPTIIHFAGHIISAAGKGGRFPAENEEFVSKQIANKLDELNVLIGYGSLAAGADILIAEQLLARGGELHVVLPFDKHDFVEVSVAGSGSQWVTRFAECLERASSITYSSTGSYNGNDALFHHCSIYAMGRACLRKQHLDAPITQVVVWSGDTTTHIAGTFSDRALWNNMGYSTSVIPVAVQGLEAVASLENEQLSTPLENQLDSQLKSVVFGDVAGFSKLTDVQIPVFVERVMGGLAKALTQSLQGSDQSMMSINTWGDGIFIVFSDVMVAAKCAMELQKAMLALELSEYGIEEQPQLRLGAHFGPVFEFEDPLTKRPNYFGQHVNTAARIEPIAPQGEVYVTEAFAAQLALDRKSKFQADYVGEMELAKKYGKARMYLLRH